MLILALVSHRALGPPYWVPQRGEKMRGEQGSPPAYYLSLRQPMVSSKGNRRQSLPGELHMRPQRPQPDGRQTPGADTRRQAARMVEDRLAGARTIYSGEVAPPIEGIFQ